MDAIKWITDVLKALVEGHYFGQVVLTFRAGRLVNMKKEESVSLPAELQG
jgi:uncharacterized protein YdeI (YjbR/CyaY-like superfamily)